MKVLGNVELVTGQVFFYFAVRSSTMPQKFDVFASDIFDSVRLIHI